MTISFSDEAVAQRFFQMADDVSTIKERLQELPEIKAKVEKHETAYKVGKILGLPALGLFHISIKHFLSKIGW